MPNKLIFTFTPKNLNFDPFLLIFLSDYIGKRAFKSKTIKSHFYLHNFFIMGVIIDEQVNFKK